MKLRDACWVSCLLISLTLSQGESSMILMRVGIVYDGYSGHLLETVHVTVSQVHNHTTEFDDIRIETVEINIDSGSGAYDTIDSSNLTSVIVVAKKLSCSRISTMKRKIPFYFIAGSEDSCDKGEERSSVIYLYPPNRFLLSAMLGATKKYKWSKAIVLEEENEEFSFTFADMQHARDEGLDTMAFEATVQRENLAKTLNVAKKQGVRAYILMSRFTSAELILTVAEELELTTKNFHWFIPNLFIHPDGLEKFTQTGFKVSLLYSPILTPLGVKILKDQNGTITNEHFMKEVVIALTLLSVNKTVVACRDALTNDCLDKKGEEFVCSTHVSDLITIDATVAPVADAARAATGNHGTSFTSRGSSGLLLHENSLADVKCDHCTGNYINGICNGKYCDDYNRKMTAVSVFRNVNSRSRFEDRSDGILISHASEPTTYEVSASSCLVHEFSPALMNMTSAVSALIPESAKDELANEQAQPGYYKIDADHGLPAIPQMCSENITINHQWNYRNDSCSSQLVQRAEILTSNTLFIVEYIKDGNESDLLTPLVVGKYTSNDKSQIKINYDPLLAYDVVLPDRYLMVGAIYHSPWLTWKVDEETGEEKFDGFLYEILERLSTSMNFTFKLLTEYDIARHTHSKSEIEAHMLEIFDNNSVDFFLHAKSVHGNRLGKSDTVLLSSSFQQPSMYLLTKRVEKTESVSIWQFMLPFREESWILFWSTFPLISLLMTYINRKNPNEYKAISHTFGPNSESSDHLGILNSLWFNFAAICGQGTDIVPRSTACKMLTGAWWGFVLLVLSAYTANMTAFMTQVNAGGIETLQALAGQQEFKYGIMEQNAMLTLFLPDAKDKPYTTMNNYFKRNNGTIIRTQEEAFQKIQQGNFYLVASFESAVDALAQSCDFDLAGQGFYQYQLSLPFPRGSVYIQLFNDHIKRLRDNGVLAALENEWFTLEESCESTSGDSGLENQLDIKAFIGMYVFLVIGVMGGVLICLLETGWIKCGGVNGVFGRARVYEFDVDRKEILKANEVLEKEFENWEGGWDVWKCKEWKEEKAGNSPAKSPEIARKRVCDVCHRPIGESISFHGESAEARDISFTHEAGSISGDSKDSGRESAISAELVTSDDPDELKSRKSRSSETSRNEDVTSRKEGQILHDEGANSADERNPTDKEEENQNIVSVVADLHSPPMSFTESPSSSFQHGRSDSGASSLISHPSLASGTLSFFTDGRSSQATSRYPSTSRCTTCSITEYDDDDDDDEFTENAGDDTYESESVYSRATGYSYSELGSGDDYTDEERSLE